MTTKLEEVARSLAVNDPTNEFGSNAWESYVPMARAAIEAMLNTTPEIRIALFDAFKDEGTDRRRINTGIWWEGHCAMISAALAEGPK